MKLTKRGVNNFLLWGFLLICIFFPGDPYKVKLFFLGTLIIINIGSLIRIEFSWKLAWVFCMGLIYPCIVMAQSMILSGKIYDSISSAYVPIILLLIFPTLDYQLSFRKQVITLLKAMSVFTLGIAVLDIAQVLDVNDSSNFLRTAFYRFDMGLMGKSVAYSSYYRIFFKTSPLLLILLDDSVDKKKYGWILVSFAALWFSGTRANVFAAVIILFVRFGLWNESNTVKTNRILFSIVILTATVVFMPRIIRIVNSIMSASGSQNSDMIRNGALRAYNNMFSDPVKLIIGSGYGSSFYNYGMEVMATTSELSYMELIRCQGIVLAMIFISFIVYPVFSRKIERGGRLTYLLYLISAAINPLLFSSTAMIMYSYYYLIILEKDRDTLDV